MKIFGKTQIYAILCIGFLFMHVSIQDTPIIEDKGKIQDSYIFPSGYLEFELNEYLNFENVKYPLSFEIKSEEQPEKSLNFGYTYRENFALLDDEVKYIKGFGQIGFSSTITKNLVILVSWDQPKILLRRIHGSNGFAGQFTQIDLEAIDGYKCEDATYDQKNTIIFLVCRNKSKQKLSIFAIDHRKDEILRYEVIKRIEIDYKEDLNFKILNRVKINSYDKNILGTQKRVITLSDRRTSLETDQTMEETFGLKLIQYQVLTDPKTKKSQIEFTVSEDALDINELPKGQITIYDVFPYGSDFVMLYTYNKNEESGENFCLTKLDVVKGDLPILSFNENNPVYKSDVSSKDGYLSLTQNNQNGYLIFLKSEEGVLTIQKVKTKGSIQSEDYKWLGDASYLELSEDYGIKNGKKAVREISLSQNNGFLVKIIDIEQQGDIQDSKSTLFGFFNSENRQGQIELLGSLNPQNSIPSTGTFIDDILIEFRTVNSKQISQIVTKDKEILFRRLGDPFLSIFTGDLLAIAKDKEINLNIKVTDSDSKPIILKSKIILVNDPYDTIEFSKTIEDTTNIKYSENMLIQHQFSYTALSKGNSPKFNFKYGEFNPPGLKGLILTHHKHNINFANPNTKYPSYFLNGIEEIKKNIYEQNESHPMYHAFYSELGLNQEAGDELLIDAYNAAALKKSKNIVEFYTCYATSVFNTFCEYKTSIPISRGIGSFKPVLKPFNDLFFGIETFTTGEGDNKKVSSTNLWYWNENEGWNYENYEGEIKEVGHIYSKEGRIYIGIIQEFSITWAVFSNDWTYGNFRFQKFSKEDVDSLDFCPTSIQTGFDRFTEAYVISQCDDDVELFTFGLEIIDPDSLEEGEIIIPSIEFKASRTLFKSRKNIQLCVLKNEVIVYGESSNPQEPKIQSYDIKDSTRRYNLDTSKFGIENIKQFTCFGRLNQFMILNYQKAKTGAEVDSTEVYIFTGGRQYNVYKLLNQKIIGLDAEFDQVHAYTHQGSTIVYLSSKEKPTIKGQFYRVYNTSPLLLTSVGKEDNFENLPQQIKLTISISSDNSRSINFVENLNKSERATRSIGPMETKPKWIKSQNLIDISKNVQRSGALWSVKIKDPSSSKGVIFKSFEDSDPILYLDLEFLGSYDKHDDVHIVSTSDSFAQVEPGIIKFYQKPTSSYSINDQFKTMSYYTPKPIIGFTSASIPDQNNGLFIAFITPLPTTLNWMFFEKKIDIGKTELPKVYSSQISCKSIKYFKNLLFCSQTGSKVIVYQVLFLDGKPTLSEDFKSIKDVKNFQLVDSGEKLIEFIYPNFDGLGIYKRQIQIDGFLVNEPIQIIDKKKAIIDWVSCRNTVDETKKVYCAYGGEGAAIHWGYYDSSSETIIFKELGSGLRVSKVDTRSKGGFIGVKHTLQYLENIESDNNKLIQVIDLQSSDSLKEAYQVVELMRDTTIEQKENYNYRLINSFSRDNEDYLLIEERIRGKDSSILFEKKLTRWNINPNNRDLNEIKDVELVFNLDSDSKQTEIYKIGELFE